MRRVMRLAALLCAGATTAAAQGADSVVAARVRAPGAFHAVASVRW